LRDSVLVVPYTGSDRTLLQLTHAGDPLAFDAFYRRHRQWVLAYFARRTSPENAADLTAETFAASLEQTRAGKIPDSPPAWLLTVAHNKLIGTYRRGSVETAARQRLGMERLELNDADLERVLEIGSEIDILAELRTHLPEDQALALQARFLEEQSYEAIADRLQVSEATARQRVSRALKALRRRMEIS
jgi:RNA polymerase sigma factor (sigma-70 family)